MVKIQHISNKGTITIVSKPQGDWKNLSDTTIAYGLSMCSPNDAFVKRTGVDLAKTRMDQELEFSGTVFLKNFRANAPKLFYKISLAMYINIIKHHPLPKWAQAALYDRIEHFLTILETSSESV